MTTAVACILFLGVIVYAIFGGADFGAGIWDLLAGGTRRGRKPRQVIDRSIGPVWEANHVWLIFVFVVLWTAFPTAYASITLTLFVPLSLAALGIVLRGASFAFRHAVYKTEEQRVYGAFFALGSLLVPFAFGAWPGRSPPAGSLPAAGPATRGQAGSTPRRCSAACSPSSPCRTCRPCCWCSTPGGWPTPRWSSTSGAGRSSPPWSPGSSPSPGSGSSTPMPATCSTSSPPGPSRS